MCDREVGVTQFCYFFLFVVQVFRTLSTSHFRGIKMIDVMRCHHHISSMLDCHNR
jgi:hypothetical protein